MSSFVYRIKWKK